MQKRIPITKAKELSKQYGWSRILIIGIDDSDDSGCITTYGTTKKLCKLAEELGDNLGKQIFKNNKEDVVLNYPEIIIHKELKHPKVHVYNHNIPPCKYLTYDSDGEHCSIHKGIGVSDSCQYRHDDNTCIYLELEETK